MSTRLNLSQVNSFVKTTLLNVNDGLAAAFSTGLILQMPEAVEFDLDIIIDGATMQTVTDTTDTETGGEGGTLSTTSTGAGNTTESSSGSTTQVSSTTDSSTTTISRAYNQFVSS